MSYLAFYIYGGRSELRTRSRKVCLLTCSRYSSRMNLSRAHKSLTLLLIILFIRVCFCNYFLEQYFFLKLIDRNGNGKTRMEQLFSYLQMFFHQPLSKHWGTWSSIPASLLGSDFCFELTWSGAMLFIWLRRMRENKHCSGTLIKDTTVAFLFHCPRTYNSTDHIVTWQL